MKGKNSQGIGRLKFGEGRPLVLKIIYPNCCGIDVHKTFVVAVIAITDKQGLTTYHSKRFSTFTNWLVQLRDLFRYRMKLTQLQVSEKNRYQNCLLGLIFKLQVSFPTCSEKVLRLLFRASLTIQRTNQTLSSWFTRK